MIRRRSHAGIAALIATAALCLALVLSATIPVADAQIPRPVPRRPKYEYGRAIHMGYLYFWAQMSGKLPYQRLAWRGDSCLDCTGPNGEDITGGWYEASNALLFGFPYQFTHTVLAWTAWEYETVLTRIGEIDEARLWVRHGAEWTLNAHSAPDRLVAMRGIAEGSDFLWQGPPEEWTAPYAMNYRRNNASFVAYVSRTNRGSEISGQAAAAMAVSAMVFRRTDPEFADRCLNASRSLYSLATDYPGSFTAGPWAQRHPAMKFHRAYYESSGYHDELALASAFLYLATNETRYLTRAKTFYNRAVRKVKVSYAYSWDDKLLAVALLLMKIENRTGTIYETMLRRSFTYWLPGCVGRMCAPGDPGVGSRCQCVFKTPRGLHISDAWGSLASVNNANFLALQFAKFLRKFNRRDAYATRLVNWSITQVNYVLGDNQGHSFMVGFGRKYARYPLHISSFNSWIDFPMRGATPFQIQQNFTQQGYSRPGEEAYWNNPRFRVPQRFIVYGAVQGGPEYYNDRIVDDHWNFTFTEPAVDYSAVFISAAAGLVDLYNIRTKTSDCGLDLGWNHPNARRAERQPRYPADDCYHKCC